MKKIILIILFLTLGGLMGCGLLNKNQETSEYLRIHIRANSNLEIDQNVKYLVKDAVVQVMIPFLSECETKSEAENTIKNNFNLIE